MWQNKDDNINFYFIKEPTLNVQVVRQTPAIIIIIIIINFQIMHLKFIWTLFKNVHCQGPCSMRPCILRHYRNLGFQKFQCEFTTGSTPNVQVGRQTPAIIIIIIIIIFQWGLCKCGFNSSLKGSILPLK